MSDDKFRVQIEVTRDLVAHLQRLGLSEEDFIAVVTCKFESDEQARRIAAVIEADDAVTDARLST